MYSEVELRQTVERYCVDLSKNPLMVQAAGGNVSWKSGKTLWIKASGMWLADAERKDIFVPVDCEPLLLFLSQSSYKIEAKASMGYTLRPSIETLLHVIMPHKLVFHLHPVHAVAHLICDDCETTLSKKLADLDDWEILNYKMPGPELAQSVHELLQAKPDTKVILLRNHGVIIGSDSLEEINEILKILEEKLHLVTRPSNVTNLRRLSPPLSPDPSYRFAFDEELQVLVHDAELFDRLNSCWAICPDHIVFLGDFAFCMDNFSDSTLGQITHISSPPFIFIKNKGVFERNTVSVAQLAQLKFYVEIMIRLPAGKSVTLLSQDQAKSLYHWEPELYRQSLNLR